MGTFRVNTAAVVVAEGDAGLRKAGLRLQALHGCAKREQRSRIVSRLQFHVAEENAIAAKAAGQAKLAGNNLRRLGGRIAHRNRDFIDVHPLISTRPLDVRWTTDDEQEQEIPGSGHS